MISLKVATLCKEEPVLCFQLKRKSVSGQCPVPSCGFLFRHYFPFQVDLFLFLWTSCLVAMLIFLPV